MKIKILDAVLAIICVSVAVTLIVTTRISLAQQQLGKAKVTTVQLFNPLDGKFPLQLEIIPETTVTSSSVSSARSGSVQFKMTNKSTKRIDAYGVEILTTAVINGQEITSTAYTYGDWNLHPTSQDLGKRPPFEPGGEVTGGPYSLHIDNGTIKEVTFKMDYILFDDGSDLKASEKSGKSILGNREGAKKYRQWAKKYYKDNHESLDMLSEQLKDKKFSSDINFGEEETLGAKLYRDYLLVLYKKDKTALERHLKEEK